MTPEGQDSFVAEVRHQALGFVDPIKAALSVALGASTPTICLACQHSNAMGDECGKGQAMMGEVKNKWLWGSDYNTPLTDICFVFRSNVSRK